MFGSYKSQKIIIQKIVFSNDYKRKYLITMYVSFGRVISKSVIDITDT